MVLRLLLPSRPTATGCDIICEDPEDARRHDFYETAKDAGCSEDEDAELLTPVVIYCNYAAQENYWNDERTGRKGECVHVPPN